MKYLKNHVFFLALGLSIGLCYGQKKGETHIQLCAAETMLTLKDQIISKLRYKGSAPGISVRFQQSAPNGFYFADLRCEKGFYTRNSYFNPAAKRIDHLGFRAQLAYFKSLRSRKAPRWQLFVGGLISGLVDDSEVLPFSNSRSITYGILDIAPAMAMRRAFRLFNRNYRFESSLSIPIAAYTWTPQYGVPNFNGSCYKGLQTFGHYFRVLTRAALHYELPRSANGFFLAYEWNYRQLSVKNKVQSAAQRCTIGLSIYL